MKTDSQLWREVAKKMDRYSNVFGVLSQTVINDDQWVRMRIQLEMFEPPKGRDWWHVDNNQARVLAALLLSEITKP